MKKENQMEFQFEDGEAGDAARLEALKKSIKDPELLNLIENAHKMNPKASIDFILDHARATLNIKKASEKERKLHPEEALERENTDLR